MHREFSMARAKYGSVSAPSYIIQLEYISGNDTYIFGKLYEFTLYCIRRYPLIRYTSFTSGKLILLHLK